MSNYQSKIVMRLIYSFILVVVCLAPLPCHAQEASPEVDVVDVEEKEPNSREHYQKEGVTIVASENWKPFSFEDEMGNHVGFLVEMWEKWSEKTGIQIRLVYTNWEDSLERMKVGTADVHSGVYFDDERSEYMDYADSVFSSKWILAIRKDAPVDCSNALSAGSFGCVEGDLGGKRVLAQYPDVKMVTYPNTQMAVVAFLEGEVDCVGTSYASLLMEARARGVIDVFSVCRTLAYQEVYPTVTMGETELLKLVNEGFEEMSAEELQQIRDRWFVAEEEPELDWKTAVLPAGAALVFVIATIVLWMRRRV